MVNVGSRDRAIRFVLGAVLVAAIFLPSLSGWLAPLGPWKYTLTAWGVVMLLTAALRVCPTYTVLGIRTCPAERH